MRRTPVECQGENEGAVLRFFVRLADGVLTNPRGICQRQERSVGSSSKTGYLDDMGAKASGPDPAGIGKYR